ncbi:MAG: hypothetical protein WBB23_08810 [Desulforhopalus sp.]
MSEQKSGDYSPNATIITTGGVGVAPRPRNLISAISEIQQFYVIEKQGQNIPAEFLTLEGSLDFFRIGFKSGFNEGVFLVLLFPVFSFYLLPYVLPPPDSGTKVLFGSVPYLPVMINTLLCSYISRYYIGNITRKAVNSLFAGRAIILVTKGFLVYVFYLVLYEMSTPKRVWSVASHFKGNAETLYYGYLKSLPHLVPLATRCAVFILIAAIVPYGSVYLLDLWHKYKIKRNARLINNP